MLSRLTLSCVRAAVLALMFSGADLAAAANIDSASSLRSIGVEIKTTYDRAVAGGTIPADAVERFDRVLAKMDGDAASATPSAEKRAAIGRLLDALREQAKNPRAINRMPITRMSLDTETVQQNHGDRCATALGVSTKLPVRLTLAASASAWFRFDAPRGGPVRFATQSSVADPAIEVYRSCEGAAAIVNDDDFGLDASAALDSDRAPLFVHLTNTGKGGAIVLTVTDDLGQISGKLTDAKTGAPIGNGSAQIFSTNGYYQGSVTTDSSGTYSIYVAPGDYYVRGSESHHVSLLYPNAGCQYAGPSFQLSSCDVAHAQVVSVASGANVTGIVIALGQGQRLSGQIRDALGQILAGSVVLYRASDNTPLAPITSDQFGRFVFNYVPVGNYKLAAQADAHGSQMYDHKPCAGSFLGQCDLTQATTVTITDSDVTGIDFALQPLSVILGTVSGPGFDPNTCCNAIYVYDSAGNALQSVYVSDGTYVTQPLA
ncbi:MAG TPA: carboxypeptidase-like regulatory domain-containing protein, partial [Rudaea sp.]